MILLLVLCLDRKIVPSWNKKARDQSKTYFNKIFSQSCTEIPPPPPQQDYNLFFKKSVLTTSAATVDTTSKKLLELNKRSEEVSQ